MQAQILAPAAVLVCWTLVVLLWMGRARFAALKAAGVDLTKAKPGGRGQDLNGVLPDVVNWKAHNYSHLTEQPTLFYAAVTILAIMGASGMDVVLAWAYVAIRIVHSLWQATVNRVPVRFRLFLLSSLCLIALAVRAASVTLFSS